jgi:hypothetical protein
MLPQNLTETSIKRWTQSQTFLFLFQNINCSLRNTEIHVASKSDWNTGFHQIWYSFTRHTKSFYKLCEHINIKNTCTWKSDWNIGFHTKHNHNHKNIFKILFRVTQHHVHIKLPEILYETSDARQTLITDYRPERNPNTDVTTVILTMLNTEWNVETHTKHDFNHKFIIQNVYKRLCTKWWWKTQWNLKTDMKPRGTF